MFYIALWMGKFIAFVINLIDKTRGTNKSGEFACKMCEGFIGKFKNIDVNKVIFVTGSNGKSTTNNVIAHTLNYAGIPTASNREGANLYGGIATTLIKNSNMFGKFKKDMLVLEVDERTLPKIRKVLPGKNLCVTNIQKDQMQRNCEPDLIYQLIKSTITNDMTVFVNNEEPRAKSLENIGAETVYYSMEKNDRSFIKEGFYEVTMACPKCNHRLKFDYYNIDNIGGYHCTNCDFKTEEDLKYVAKNVDFVKGTFECNGIEYKVPYTEPYYIYNFVACIAVCTKFGVKEETIKDAFANFSNVGGRTDLIKYKTKEIKYMKMKTENPETLQSTLQYIAMDKENKIVIIGLEELPDFEPHFTNTFYNYDCNYQPVIDSNVEHYICSSKPVAYDAANRLIYAGIPREKISILPTDDDSAIVEVLDKFDIDNVYLITWSGKYKRLSTYIRSLDKEAK